MKRVQFFAVAALAAVAGLAPVAQATTVTIKVLGAGSSAMWQTAATGAFIQLAGSGGGHFTIKGTCTNGANCSQIADSRSTSIVPQTGNLWVVWSNPTASTVNVWAYMSVDSVVGNRTYFATTASGTRATTIQLDPMTENGGFPSGQTNLISSNLWGVDAPTIPSVVYTALNNHIFTAGFTDIRPEDAYYANCRVLNPLDTTGHAAALGYGTLKNCGSATGININSAFSTSFAQPVAFKIVGKDPITGGTISKSNKGGFTTIPVGAEPVIPIVNRTNTTTGLGIGGAGTPLITDISVAQIQCLWSGAATTAPCPIPTGQPGAGLTTTQLNSSATANIYVIQREPMSGTMNTWEFTNIRCSANVSLPNTTCNEGPVDPPSTLANLSQETGVGQPTTTASPTNPLNLPTGSTGSRMRAIGTGELVGTGVKNTTDSIGYTFFSYGNVSKIAGSATWGYLTLDGVDGIVSENGSYTNGELPVCTSTAGSGVCPAAPGTSFWNLRQGTYRSWSVVRTVTDKQGANLTNLKALVTAIQNNVNLTTPDFVPFVGTAGDPGLTVYRSHFTQASQTGNNGLSGETEAGGDVGGCIEPVSPAPGVLNCNQ